METRAFWACCALAGLRQSEAAALVYGQIWDANTCVGIRDQGLGIGAARIIGLFKRGNAPDFVEISEELRLVLQNLIPNPYSLIPNNKIFTNLPKHASQRTRDLQSVAGCSVSFNLLRYSFGANLILQGISLEAVRRQMRFASLKELVQAYGDGGIIR